MNSGQCVQVKQLSGIAANHLGVKLFNPFGTTSFFAINSKIYYIDVKSPETNREYCECHYCALHCNYSRRINVHSRDNSQ